MKEEVLMEIGFSKNEAIVYITLLNLGQTTATEIAKESKIHRTNVYDSLKNLVKKGVVTHIIKNKTTLYESTNPDNLMNFIKEKELRLNEIMPQLKMAEKFSKSKGEAEIAEGVSAFMNTLYSFLKYNETILAFGIPKSVPDIVRTKIPHFHKERIPKKIMMKHIYNHDASDRIKYLNKLSYTQARSLPQRFDSMVSTIVCGEEVLFTLWTDDVVTIRIKNAKLADSYKNYFELLWGAAK